MSPSVINCFELVIMTV